MSNAMSTAAAGLIAHQARMDMLSNDIANISTAGYKSARVAFKELIGADGSGAGSRTVELGRSLTPGVFQESGNPLSVAINGPGFLQVRRGDGSLALTRSGELRLDAAGGLVTAAGERLEPPITLPQGTSASSVRIGQDGSVSANEQPAGKIDLFEVPAPTGLLSVSGNLFVATEASGAPTVTASSTLQQGMTEASNVDLGAVMVEMMLAQRGFQLASRAVQTQDQMLQITNQIRRF